jgi:hypothetical protein
VHHELCQFDSSIGIILNWGVQLLAELVVVRDDDNAAFELLDGTGKRHRGTRGRGSACRLVEDNEVGAQPLRC